MHLRCNLEMELTRLGKERRAECSRRGMRMEGSVGGGREHLGPVLSEADKQQGCGTSVFI